MEEGGRKEHRVTAPAVQPLGQRLFVSVCVWMLHVWACVQLALTVSPLPLCVSEIFFFQLNFCGQGRRCKMFSDVRIHLCKRSCGDREEERERVWASRRQRSRFERFTWLRFVPSKTPTSQICCS